LETDAALLGKDSSGFGKDALLISVGMLLI
jgi:hypothetical protein